jgi:uncharacterized damage-inducible protein DinB
MGTLHHYYLGERFWAGCLRANRMPPMEEIGPAGDPPEPKFEGLERDWPQVWNGLREWLEPLKEEELTLTISSRLASGRDFDFTRWQILRHCVNHSTLHRGQVVGMLRMMGKQPPNVDLMTYYLV